jgi:multiple sugar transport system substrate-binding protein
MFSQTYNLKEKQMAQQSKPTISRRDLLRMAAWGITGAVFSACGAAPAAQAPAPTSAPVAPAATVAPAAPAATAAPAAPAATAMSAATSVPAPSAVTLDFWQPFGDITGDAMGKLVKTWNDQHPEIQVKISYTPNVTSAGSNPKFLAAALSGNPPDIFIHDGSSFASSTVLNAFTPLDDYVTSSGIKTDSFYKFAWDKVQWDGKVYGLPLNTDARAMYSNTKLLKAAGFDKPPATIEELDAMADKLAVKEGDRYTQLGIIPWAGNWFLVGWGWDYGAEPWDAATNKIKLNAPEMVKALEWETAYAKKYGVQALQSFQSGFGSGADDPFVRGNVAMTVTGNWVIANLAKYAPDLEYTISPAPHPAAGKAITWSGGFVVGIPRGSKHIAESWQFISWLTSAEPIGQFCKETQTLPCNVAAAEAMGASDARQKVFIDLMPESRIEPVIPEWSLAWDQHVAAEQAAILLQKEPQQALDDANAKVQEAVDQRLSGV